MSDYPRMLYRKGGEEIIHGLECETMIAETPEMEGLVEADGWRRTPQEAHGQPSPRHEPEAQIAAAAGEAASLRAQLDAERDARQAAEAELAEARDTIADLRADLDAATKPAETEGRKTLSAKKGGADSAAG